MTKCFYCNKEIQRIPFRCKYCGKIYCHNHRLPENHDCSYFFLGHHEAILYQDTLEFMNKDLSVADVYHYFTTKEYTEDQTIELLQFFIENNDNPDIRILSLEALKLLELNKDKVFSILESSVLSDENSRVKQIGIKILKDIFPKKSENILKWIKETE